MFADRDYERKPVIRTSNDTPRVSVLNCLEKGYSVVNIQCKDRTKLLFDVVCTLTDMQYVVFHATIDSAGDRAYLVYSFTYLSRVLGIIHNAHSNLAWTDE